MRDAGPTARRRAGARLLVPERLVWLLLVLGSFLQQPGRTTFDTKYDLAVDPAGLLERSLHLWNPEASFGELQNQAYGYLFPQGPFFLLGDLAGLPPWVVQRLWSALLLVAAFEGVRLVARALGTGRAAAVTAGLAYALAPRLVGASGVLSGEVLPSAWLPWMVLPLVLVGTGQLTPRTGGLLSGVAVLLMSGVNAVGTAATLPAGAAVVLAQWRRPHGRRLLAWWLAALAAAAAWWLVPLLLLGRYSPPFLDFIETATATTSTTGWANSLRGTDHWLAWTTLVDRAWWPGAHEIATTPLLMAVGAATSALGLWGLCRHTMPARGPLLASTVVGLLCLVVGAAASGGSLVDPWVRELLDGPLAPLRNVHKVDPLVRFGLALGLGHAVGVLAPAFSARLTRFGRDASERVRRLFAPVVCLLLLIGAAPLFDGHLRMAGWEEVPEAWTEAADWLADQPGSRALVVPGSGFGMQEWGWTIDEPLQALASAPWVTRSQVPLVPGPTARVLDAIERRLTSGHGSPGLAAFLARAGVTHVVLRRDLDTTNADTVPVARVEAALDGSDGLRSVAGFGSTAWGQPMVEVWEVDRAVTRVSVVATDALRTLDGAPDDLLTAADAGLLDGDRPVRISSPTEGAAELVGDGQVRVERQFGRVHDARSAVLAGDDDLREDRPNPDYPGVPGIAETVAVGDRGVRISATSSAGYADVIGPSDPAHGPAAAHDGSELTSWRSAPFTRPEGQALTVHAPEGLDAGVVRVRFALDDDVVRVSRVAVDVGRGPVVHEVPPTGVLAVPLERPGTTELTVEVRAVSAGDREIGTVAVSELVLPGVEPGRTRVVPGAAGEATDLVLHTDVGRRACLDNGRGTWCDATNARSGEEHGRLDRTVATTEAGEWRLSGTVVAAPSAATAALLAPLGRGATVEASSVLADDPAASGVFAFDGDPRTAWLTAPGAAAATLTWRWNGKPRTIDRIRTTAPFLAAAAPTRAVLRAGGEVREVDLTGLGTFAPMRVDGELTVTFERPAGRTDLPLGVAEVHLDGMEPLRHAPDRSAGTGAACGLGPDVEVDGRVLRTRVNGTIADLLRGSALAWRACGTPVELPPGEHRIRVRPTLQFLPATLALAARQRPVVRPEPRTLAVHRWDATRREVEVGPGDEVVLRVAENTNPGWRATLDGEQLQQVDLDGWQQGYVVPAGEGGRVVVEFGPDPTYRAGLLGGLLLAGSLLLGALGSLVRDRSGRRRDAATHGGSAWPAPGVRRPLPRPAAAAVALLLGVVGGPFVALGWLAALVLPRRQWAALVGAALAAGSGAVAAWLSGDPASQPGLVADALAAGGVGLLLASVCVPLPGPGLLRRPPRPSALTTVALVLVAGQAVLRWVLASGSWFWQDDFLHLSLAHQLGLGREFLVRDYSGHLEVGQYFLFWLLAGNGTSFTSAALFLVGGQVLASLLLWAVLRSLFPPSWWLLVPFAAYLFTPLGLVTGAWWAAGMQAFPLQVAMLTTLLGMVHLHRGGRRARWWGVLALVAHAAGLVFWEKALLVLPAVLATHVLVVLSGATVRERVRVVLRSWRWWGAHLGLVAAYLVVYLDQTSTSTLAGERSLSWRELLHATLGQVTVPGMFGGPWHTDGAENTLMPDTGPFVVATTGLLLLGLVAASIRRRGRAALGGWFLAAGCLLADVLLLGTGRAEYLGLVARDPRYVTDALPLVVVGVCAAFAVPRGSVAAERRRHAVRTRPAPRRAVRRPLAATGLVVASAMATNLLLVPIVQRDAGLPYLHDVLDAVDAHPGAMVLAAPVTEQVAVSVRVQELLLAVDSPRGFGQAGTSAVFLDERGRPHDVALLDRTDLGGPSCTWVLSPEPTELLDVVRAGNATGDLAVRLRMLASTPVVLHLRAGSLEQAVALEQGLAEAWFAVPAAAAEGRSLRAWVTPWPGAAAVPPRQCATELSLGVPWPVG